MYSTRKEAFCALLSKLWSCARPLQKTSIWTQRHNQPFILQNIYIKYFIIHFLKASLDWLNYRRPEDKFIKAMRKNHSEYWAINPWNELKWEDPLDHDKTLLWDAKSIWLDPPPPADVTQARQKGKVLQNIIPVLAVSCLITQGRICVHTIVLMIMRSWEMT